MPRFKIVFSCYLSIPLVCFVENIRLVSIVIPAENKEQAKEIAEDRIGEEFALCEFFGQVLAVEETDEAPRSVSWADYDWGRTLLDEKARFNHRALLN